MYDKEKQLELFNTDSSIVTVTYVQQHAHVPVPIIKIKNVFSAQTEINTMCPASPRVQETHEDGQTNICEARFDSDGVEISNSIIWH